MLMNRRQFSLSMLAATSALALPRFARAEGERPSP